MRFVIDTCTQKVGTYNVTEQRTVLTEEWYGKVNGIQRAGRVGRTCDGVVIRLLPKGRWAGLQESIPTEIQRCDLSEMLLKLLDGSRLTPYDLLSKCNNAPQPTRITAALSSLVREECLAVLEDEGPTSMLSGSRASVPHTVYSNKRFALTSLGRTLIMIPGSIAGGRMLLIGVAMGLGPEACVVAALQSKPFPVIRTYRNPMITFVETRRFALGCRSDCIGKGRWGI